MSLPLSSRRTNFLSGGGGKHNHQSEICLPKESTGRVNLMKNSRSSDDHGAIRDEEAARMKKKKEKKKKKKKEEEKRGRGKKREEKSNV